MSDLTKVRPLLDRVIIQRDKVEEKSKGGILLSTSAQKRPRTGKVLAVGLGLIDGQGKRREMLVKEGDRVLIDPTAYGEDGEDVIAIRETDIIGVVT